MATTPKLKELTIDEKKDIYVRNFSLCTNTNASIDDKFKLLYLICFLSKKLTERNPEKFKTPLDVLQDLYGRDFSEQNGENSFIIALGIICEDLLYGVNEMKKPEGFSNAQEICTAIKDLISQWMPF